MHSVFDIEFLKIFFYIFIFQIICYLTKKFYIFYRYWLFGEKEQKEGEAKFKRIRGWLPRPCAVEVIEKSVWH